MAAHTLHEGNRAGWLRMRRELWPSSDPEDAERWLSQKDTMTLVAADEAGDLVGFAEVAARVYADGCDTSPVAFLEGWFVEPSRRGEGWGKQLLQAAQDWARSQNLSELASDALLEDAAAIAAHVSNGFEEVERSVKFRMTLS